MLAGRMARCSFVARPNGRLSEKGPRHIGGGLKTCGLVGPGSGLKASAAPERLLS